MFVCELGCVGVDELFLARGVHVDCSFVCACVCGVGFARLQWRAVPAHLRTTSNVRRRANAATVRQQRAAHRRGSVVRSVLKADWVKVFRVVSMVLFIGYPSVSIKIFRLFRCIQVSGRPCERETCQWVFSLVYNGSAR